MRTKESDFLKVKTSSLPYFCMTYCQSKITNLNAFVLDQEVVNVIKTRDGFLLILLFSYLFYEI